MHDSPGGRGIVGAERGGMFIRLRAGPICSSSRSAWNLRRGVLQEPCQRRALVSDWRRMAYRAEPRRVCTGVYSPGGMGRTGGDNPGSPRGRESRAVGAGPSRPNLTMDFVTLEQGRGRRSGGGVGLPAQDGLARGGHLVEAGDAGGVGRGFDHVGVLLDLLRDGAHGGDEQVQFFD
jgi:hypothetical protein